MSECRVDRVDADICANIEEDIATPHPSVDPVERLWFLDVKSLPTAMRDPVFALQCEL